MVLFFTRTYDEPYAHYKAIFKKEKSKKFRLVRIEKTIPYK